MGKVSGGANALAILEKFEGLEENIRNIQKIETKTFTATTASNGSVAIPGIYVQNHIILQTVIAGNDSNACFLTRWNNNYYIYCFDFHMNALKNIEFTFEINYMKR